jgi:Fe-S-cluster containining protein
VSSVLNARWGARSRAVAAPVREVYDVAGENQGGVESPMADLQYAQPALVPGRSCGTCSLCCKVLPVEALSKPAGKWCIHSVPGLGCAAHADRPQACRQFFCAWRLDSNLGPEWKPEVCRFVLSADPAHGALTLMVDPGMPLAWKREPYYARLKQFSEASFRQNRKLLVNLRGNITVILPDRDVPIGVITPGEEIVIWREGSIYGAGLRRDLERARTFEKTSEQTSSARASLERPGPQPIPASDRNPGDAPSPDDPDFLRSLFAEVLEKTCKLLDDPRTGDLRVSGSTILRGRNKVLDETAASYARAGRAECQAGCTSCCYLMVLGTPYEVLSIARYLLETKTQAEIEGLKQRLLKLSEVPLDPTLRLKAKMPCALLENGRCSIYEHRPSLCRMTLSQSRAACDSCLQEGSGSIPYIEQPSKIAAVMQMGIDYALIARRNLSTEGAELSRALLIALRDYEGALTSWLAGEDPFPDTHVGGSGIPSNRERAIAAARRFGAA